MARLSKRMSRALRTAHPVTMASGCIGHELSPQRMSVRQFSLWADSVRRLGFATWNSGDKVERDTPRGGKPLLSGLAWLLTAKGARALSRMPEFRTVYDEFRTDWEGEIESQDIDGQCTDGVIYFWDSMIDARVADETLPSHALEWPAPEWLTKIDAGRSS